MKESREKGKQIVKKKISKKQTQQQFHSHCTQVSQFHESLIPRCFHKDKKKTTNSAAGK